MRSPNWQGFWFGGIIVVCPLMAARLLNKYGHRFIEIGRRYFRSWLRGTMEGSTSIPWMLYLFRLQVREQYITCWYRAHSTSCGIASWLIRSYLSSGAMLEPPVDYSVRPATSGWWEKTSEFHGHSPLSYFICYKVKSIDRSNVMFDNIT
jgi:hypothetical protein